MTNLLIFESPTMLWVALVALAGAMVAALVRRPPLPALTWALGAAGALGIALAAGAPQGRRDLPSEVAVLVDVSPSTRSATYHEPSRLSRRLAQLLGSTPYRLYAFSGEGEMMPVASVDRLPAELSADETIYAPLADAKVVLLFSDARFRGIPSGMSVLPPTYLVLDPALESAADGRVEQLELRGPNDEEVAITVDCSGNEARHLELTGMRENPPGQTAPGRVIVRARRDPAAMRITARLQPPDAWPENDALELVPPAPSLPQRWWVSESNASRAAIADGWRTVRPSALPSELLDYLPASIIALDDVPADALSPLAQRRLQQYVRELGGGLMILGGEHAFAAGGYIGTPLDALSPLSSAPPRPTTHWVLLADASGSMASPANADANEGAGVAVTSRWQMATAALLGVIPLLPPDDLLSTGSFARELRWWTQSQPVRQTSAARDQLPPRDLLPQGPTNLQAALQLIAATPGLPMQTELLILSDADATIDHPRELAATLSAARVRVHLLATAPLRDDNPLRSIVDATGGRVIAQTDAQRWSDGLKQLLRAAESAHLEHNAITVTFRSSLELPPRTIESWNRTWPKGKIDLLATARDETGTLTISAARRDGLGRVVAIALAPTAAEVARLASLGAQPPRDPRFSVHWEQGASLRVALDATDRAATKPYLNDLKPLLRLWGEGAADEQRIAMAQTAPGRYEAMLAAPRSPRVATVLLDDRVIDRRALAGRYVPEFSAIGNDRAMMRQIAQRSGGRIIEPSETSRLDLRRPAQRVDLTPILAIAGAVLIALGVLHWHRRT